VGPIRSSNDLIELWARGRVDTLANDRERATPTALLALPFGAEPIPGETPTIPARNV